MSLIQANNVDLGPGVSLFRGSFALPQGITALIGPNGAGKTTLLRALQGYDLVRGGDLHVLGRPLTEYSPRELAQAVSVVAQESRAPFHLTGRDLVRMGLLAEVGWWKPFPADTEQRVDGALAALGVTALQHRTLEKLSTGERQKMYLAQAIVRLPQLLLLDEPTSHLDPGATARFWAHLQELGYSAVIATHDLGFLKSHCAWVLAVKEGETIFSGPSEEYFHRKDGLALYD